MRRNRVWLRETRVELGRGSYGKVYAVEYDGTLCASKEVHRWMLELPTAEEQSKIKDDFLRECRLWSTLRHPNVVLFLGIYYPSSDESGLPVMVMEKMQESITSLVDKHDNIPLLVKLSILYDVSLGLRYLHGHNPPIVHRDLSPNNILVTPRLEAKITDLGVAKAITMGSNSKTMTKTPGTAVFMPPEALDDKPVYGPTLDVFSFGGVILHITSRQWPTPKGIKQIDPKTRKRIFLSEVEQRQQYLDMMTGNDADLKPLVVSCLEDDPELRPPAADMSERIKVMKEKYSKKTTRDGMDPIMWLAEAKLPVQLQVCALIWYYLWYNVYKSFVIRKLILSSLNGHHTRSDTAALVNPHTFHSRCTEHYFGPLHIVYNSSIPLLDLTSLLLV